MPYPELLALIDAKLSKLRFARELLATSALPPTFKGETEFAELSLSAAAGDEEDSSTEPVIDAPDHAVQHVRPAARRERRSAARTKEPAPTALNGARPTGPVFVPANRLVKPENMVAPEAGDGMEKPSDIPTAAQLAQRWLHASS
jgi:hypothetical protein